MTITGNFTGEGVEPTVASATYSDKGALRVTFSEAMEPNTELETISNYTITGATTITVQDVTFENETDPTYVDLEVDPTPIYGTDNYTITVATTVEDLAGNTLDPAGASVQFSGWVVPVDSECFEDNLPSESEMDIKLQIAITGRPYTERLRKIFLRYGSSFGNQQVGARTILWYATATDLRAICAATTDVSEVEDIQLCHRTNAVDLKTQLDRHASVIHEAAAEVRLLIGDTVFEPIEQYLNSSSPVYRASAVATLVLLAASMTPLPEVTTAEVEPPAPPIPPLHISMWYFNDFYQDIP